MDFAVLLFLPLVGGYIFARTCNFTRYKVPREDGHRLYFRSGFWGVALFIAALALHLLMFSHSARSIPLNRESRSQYCP